jgi:hypothetical protein
MTFADQLAAEILDTELDGLSTARGIAVLRRTTECPWSDDDIRSITPRDIAAVRAAYPAQARARLAALESAALDEAARCTECGGTGAESIPWNRCDACGGTGVR